MKTTEFLRKNAKYFVTLVLALVVFSCDNEKYTQTFDDVFDISGVEVLNASIVDETLLNDLNVEFLQSKLVVPEEVNNITLDEIIVHYEEALKLSNVEISMLLKNDPETYMKVINRFGSLPAKLEGLKELDFSSVKSSDLNKYVVRIKEQPENFYSTDYYTAVTEMQNYLKKAVITPMQNVNGNKGVKTVPPGQNKPNAVLPVTILYYKVISLNNVWDMWWTYWSDGKRTKHKGAAGSFPG